MNKDKMISLTKYLDLLTNRLSDAVPAKHTHRPEEFKEFLRREISTVKRKLDAAKLEGVK